MNSFGRIMAVVMREYMFRLENINRVPDLQVIHMDTACHNMALVNYITYAYSGVQHILCCVFCFVCLRLVYPVLPFSLDCPFFIDPSVFFNVYYVI
jgi:hypothetical protein